MNRMHFSLLRIPFSFLFHSISSFVSFSVRYNFRHSFSSQLQLNLIIWTNSWMNYSICVIIFSHFRSFVNFSFLLYVCIYFLTELNCFIYVLLCISLILFGFLLFAFSWNHHFENNSRLDYHSQFVEKYLDLLGFFAHLRTSF